MCWCFSLQDAKERKKHGLRDQVEAGVHHAVQVSALHFTGVASRKWYTGLVVARVPHPQRHSPTNSRSKRGRGRGGRPLRKRGERDCPQTVNTFNHQRPWASNSYHTEGKHGACRKWTKVARKRTSWRCSHLRTAHKWGYQRDLQKATEG